MNLDYLDLDSQLVSQPFRWLVDLLGDVLKPDIPTWDLRPQGLEVVPTSLLRHDAKDIEISARWSCASRMRLRGRFVVSGYDWKPLWIHVRLPHVISPPCGQRFRNTFIVDGTDSTSPWRLYPKDGTSCYEYLNQRCESIFGPRLFHNFFDLKHTWFQFKPVDHAINFSAGIVYFIGGSNRIAIFFVNIN